jgi:hypothetical protein
MKRLRFLLLAVPLAVLAAPVLAACLSCCPAVEETQAFDTRMPCCNEDCGTVRVAGVRDPALRASSSFELSEIALVAVPAALQTFAPIDSQHFSAFVASSPPVAARPLLSLRI